MQQSYPLDMKESKDFYRHTKAEGIIAWRPLLQDILKSITVPETEQKDTQLWVSIHRQAEAGYYNPFPESGLHTETSHNG